MKRTIIDTCNDVWCKCPYIELIEKEGELWMIVFDDFHNHCLFTKDEFFLKNYLHFNRINDKMYSLSDIYGGKIILTKNDVKLIKNIIDGGYENAIKRSEEIDR